MGIWSNAHLRSLPCLAGGLLAAMAGGRCEAAVTHGAVNIVSAESGGRVVAASGQARNRRGETDPRWRKENLIDGKRVEGDIVPADSYGWASDRPPAPRDPAWVVFAFAQDRLRLIGGVRLDPRTEDPVVIGRAVRNFTIEVSVTAPEGPWQRVDSFELINVPRPQEFVFGAPVRAKYVRLLITSNHGSNSSVSLGEFEVFDALVGDDELIQAITGLEAQLSALRRYSLAHGGGRGGAPDEAPPYAKSLLAEAAGGSVVRASSEAVGENGQPLPQWRATNLIDGRVATADQPEDGGPFGWSSNTPPTPDKPEWAIFQLPQETGTVIDTVVVDSSTRDPWGIGRGAQEVEVSVATRGVDGPWISVGRWVLPREPRAQVYSFPSVEAKYVRLTVMSNYGSNRYVELGEFGVYRLNEGVSVVDGICATIDNAITNLKKHREGAIKAPGGQ